MDNNEIFINKLSELRAINEFSQTEMAKKLNISRQTYNNYERGTREPSFETLTSIAQIFNVSTDYLLGYSPDTTNDFDFKLLDKSAMQLKNKLLNVGIDISDENKQETLMNFIETNKDILKILMNNNSENRNSDASIPLQFVAKGGVGAQTVNVSKTNRAKSLKALEKLKENE